MSDQPQMSGALAFGDLTPPSHGLLPANAHVTRTNLRFTQNRRSLGEDSSNTPSPRASFLSFRLTPGPRQAAEKGEMTSEAPEKHPSGAKAHVDLIALAARLKSCPVTKQEFFRSL